MNNKPFAWYLPDVIDDSTDEFFVTFNKNVADAWSEDEFKVVPMYLKEENE